MAFRGVQCSGGSEEDVERRWECQGMIDVCLLDLIICVCVGYFGIEKERGVGMGWVVGQIDRIPG